MSASGESKWEDILKIYQKDTKNLAMSQATLHDPHTEAHTTPEGNHVPSRYIPTELVCTWAYLGFALEIERFCNPLCYSRSSRGKGVGVKLGGGGGQRFPMRTSPACVTQRYIPVTMSRFSYHPHTVQGTLEALGQ